MYTETKHGKTEGWGSDHLEKETTIVPSPAGCSCWCISTPFNTLASGMSIRSTTPTLTVCKENKHGKHAQTQRTRRHEEGSCRQVPSMRARRARAGRGIARSSKEKTRAHKGLYQCRALLIVLQVVFVKTCTMNLTKHTQGDCMWITRGIAWYDRLVPAVHQLAACPSVA